MTKQYKEPFAELKFGYKYVLSEILRKRGFYNQEIIFKWNTIVGEDIASLYIPHSIKLVKKRKLQDKTSNSNYDEKVSEQVLYLTPKNGKDFYKFAYYKSNFMERINFFFGKKIYSNIVCIQDL